MITIDNLIQKQQYTNPRQMVNSSEVKYLEGGRELQYS